VSHNAAQHKPTTSIYNASVVNFYTAALAYYNAGVVAVNLKVVGLTTDMIGSM
jgi:hypothetical protein